MDLARRRLSASGAFLVFAPTLQEASIQANANLVKILGEEEARRCSATLCAQSQNFMDGSIAFTEWECKWSLWNG